MKKICEVKTVCVWRITTWPQFFEKKTYCKPIWTHKWYTTVSLKHRIISVLNFVLPSPRISYNFPGFFAIGNRTCINKIPQSWWEVGDFFVKKKMETSLSTLLGKSSHLVSVVNLFVVSTHLKNISQIGNVPQIGVKIKRVWNHHLVNHHGRS